jgi:hypothetical protein
MWRTVKCAWIFGNKIKVDGNKGTDLSRFLSAPVESNVVKRKKAVPLHAMKALEGRGV